MVLLSRDNKSKIANWWWTVDKINLSIAFFLIFVGFMLVLSASPSASNRDRLVDDFYFMKRQAVFIIAGIFLMIIVSMQDLRIIRRFAIIGFFGALIGIYITFIFGNEAKGASRWIKIAGFTLQPSEFIKPLFIVVTAWLLDASKRLDDFPGMSIAIILYFAIALGLFFQPDFGMTFLILITGCAQIFLTGISIKLIAILASFGSVLGCFAYLFHPHVRDRIDGFLATKIEIGSQIQKSLDAFANGNLLGKGAGEGEVKMSLPDVHTDFIFAMAGEEYGVWLTSVLVICYTIIIFRTTLLSLKDKNLFVMYSAPIIAISIGLQAIINMGSNLKLIPAKGMTLPFISYGGSSMLASCLAFGILLALTRKNVGAIDRDIR